MCTKTVMEFSNDAAPRTVFSNCLGRSSRCLRWGSRPRGTAASSPATPKAARHAASGRVQKGQWVRQRKPAREHETKKRVSRCHHPGSCANLEDEELHEEPHEAQDQRVREGRRQVRNRRKITVRNQFPYRFRVLASRKQEPVRLWPHVQPGQAAPDHRSGCIERPLHVLHRFLSHVGATPSQSHTLMSTSDTFNVGRKLCLPPQPPTPNQEVDDDVIFECGKLRFFLGRHPRKMFHRPMCLCCECPSHNLLAAYDTKGSKETYATTRNG